MKLGNYFKEQISIEWVFYSRDNASASFFLTYVFLVVFFLATPCAEK